MGSWLPSLPEGLESDEIARAANLEQHRRAARDRLLSFTCHTMPTYQVGRHHEKIAEVLEAFEAGDAGRVIVTVPPRHGKSELGSVRGPGWTLGRNPERQIIAASYNQELASDFGRQVRNLVGTPEYQRVFPTELADDSASKTRWHTSKGGSYVAAGVGTAITGRGFERGIIDDPHKDRLEASSVVMQTRVWDWYKSTFYTRRAPGACILLMLTRWHEGDLAGRLLAEAKKGGDQWELLEMPALAEPGDMMGREVGEALWPERWTREELLSTKQAVGPLEWSALYQQRPTPETGSYFKKEWFSTYETLPRGCRFFLASDFAVSSEQGADYTVHQVWAVSPTGDLFLVDMWRAQVEVDVGVDAALDLAAKYRVACWLNEKGVILKAIGPTIRSRMRERNVHVPLEGYARTTDKATTAQGIRGRMSAGRVLFPEGAEWMPELMSEWLRFPQGVHDDTVDPAALIGQHLDKVVAPPQGPMTGQAEGFELSW